MLVLALRSSVALLLAIAIFLVARRASGALDSPLPAVPLAVTALALVAWAAAVRLQLGDRRIGWLLAIVIVLFAFACSFPGQRAVDWLVWLTVFATFGLLPAKSSSPAVGSDKVTSRLQQFTRSRMVDGSETIAGTLLAEFAPGERTTILHVAFCPPFERLPSVDAEVADGPACDVKLAQILHQGARFEARLARASTSLERVTIEFVAADRPA
jgi:hypothetical protein